MAVLAVQQIRKMRGGAQGQLMLGADGNAYIVKFQNNPQHPRVLVNEFLATRLAAAVGLTVPPCEVVEVTDWLIENTAELQMDLGSRRERCKAGLCFGSRLAGGLMPGHLMDYLPEEQLLGIKNLREFAGMLAFDKWTCNANGRQAVFWKKARERNYAATFIDYGHCFNAGEWVFRDSPLRGVFGRDIVYKHVTAWESFEPWLSRIESLPAETVWRIADEVPPEWYEGGAAAMERVVEQLLRRQLRVRELIQSFREAQRQPFPNWRNGAGTVMLGQLEDVFAAVKRSDLVM